MMTVVQGIGAHNGQYFMKKDEMCQGKYYTGKIMNKYKIQSASYGDDERTACLRNFLYPTKYGISNLPPTDIQKHSRHTLAFRIIKINKSV
jgi:hypothetical protein